MGNRPKGLIRKVEEEEEEEEVVLIFDALFLIAL
jgi:hypothetical protein